MSTTTRWWWVRHAPVLGMDGKAYGNSEVDCDVSDGAAFRVLAARVPAGAQWVTSHLSRAKLTAAAIAEAGGYAIEPLVEPDLAEQDFGNWQGRTWAEIERSGERVYHKFWATPAHHAPPGGESFAEVASRVGGAIGRWNESSAGRDIVAVAHAGVVRAALALALGGRAAEALRFAIDPLSLTRLDRVAGGCAADEAWAVVCVNRPPGAASGGGHKIIHLVVIFDK